MSVLQRIDLGAPLWGKATLPVPSCCVRLAAEAPPEMLGQGGLGDTQPASGLQSPLVIHRLLVGTSQCSAHGVGEYSGSSFPP
eukprot:1156228-Amphidinium_carterae.1